MAPRTIVATFHGIPLTSYDGVAPYSNGHVRVLRWKRFPEDYLESAMDTLGSAPFAYDDGIKDPESLNGLENLNDYDDTLVLNVSQKLAKER